jgi:hypothetical protein
MFLGSRERPARKADTLTAIGEPIVQTLSDIQHLGTIYATTACYRNSFLLFY